MEMEAMKKIFWCWGIGNEVLKDDGIGPRLVKKLQNFLPYPNIAYATSL